LPAKGGLKMEIEAVNILFRKEESIRFFSRYPEVAQNGAE
jgi:hypothetical protein